jgi:hypothetical protein
VKICVISGKKIRGNSCNSWQKNFVAKNKEG